MSEILMPISLIVWGLGVLGIAIMWFLEYRQNKPKEPLPPRTVRVLSDPEHLIRSIEAGLDYRRNNPQHKCLGDGLCANCIRLED